MCELFALSSRFPCSVRMSFSEFASRGGRDGRLAEGWGLAFYDDDRQYDSEEAAPAASLIKRAEPACESPWTTFLQRVDLLSTQFISHIRHATQGERRLANTQPFLRQYGGRDHVFAHNGDLPQVLSMPMFRVERFTPMGDTDSERCACVLLDRMATAFDKCGGLPSLDERLHLFSNFAHDVEGFGPANFLYSDGDTLFAHAHYRMPRGDGGGDPGMWMLERACRADPSELATAGLRVTTSDDTEQRVTLLASVPLTGESWVRLPRGQCIALRAGEVVATT